MRAPFQTHASLGRLLGYLGLIPFVAMAVLSLLLGPVHQAATAFALLAYGATIVSFLGAIHWGLAMPIADGQKLRFVWGVVPSLLAWISLLLPVPFGLLLVAATLVACLLVDYAIYPHCGLRAWLGMRTILTLVATLCSVVPALAGFGLLPMPTPIGLLTTLWGLSHGA